MPLFVSQIIRNKFNSNKTAVSKTDLKSELEDAQLTSALDFMHTANNLFFLNLIKLITESEVF